MLETVTLLQLKALLQDAAARSSKQLPSNRAMSLVGSTTVTVRHGEIERWCSRVELRGKSHLRHVFHPVGTGVSSLMEEAAADANEV